MLPVCLLLERGYCTEQVPCFQLSLEPNLCGFLLFQNVSRHLRNFMFIFILSKEMVRQPGTAFVFLKTALNRSHAMSS